MKNFIYSLSRNILGSFKDYWLWHLLAMALTFIMVTTNTDWYYFVNTRSNTLNYVFMLSIVLGGILPFIIPPAIIIGGYFTKQKKAEILGWAILQAALIGSIISSIYKFFTGRVQPNIHDIATNISHNFEFGLLRHGIFWGWPSSHTTVAFAMAFTLIQLFPKNMVVKFMSLFYAIYIGIGVSFSIHWLSDCIAGAIIGTIIGIVVAKSYKDIFI